MALTAAAGEIVGLAGIVGNGQAEFLRALAGLGHATGRAELRGTPLRPGRPAAALDAGVVYLSSDRLGEGLFGTLSVRENALVSALGQFSRLGVVRPRAEARAVEEQRASLAIKAPSIDANVLSLSGGNQQKVLLARALLNQRATLLLADEPTQGVDVGARAEIYRILRQVAAAGAAVVIVSSDTRELEGLCDRVLVFSSGQVVTELRGGQVTEDAIAHAMLTSTRRRRQADSGPSRPALARLRQAARGDYVAPVVLALAIVALGVYTQSHNSRFLSSFNLTSLTVLIAATAFISFGQECVIVTGGIDLSVGPLAGLVVVIGSFFENSGHSPVVVIAGFADHDRGQRRDRDPQRRHGQVRPVHPDRGHPGHLHRPAGRVPGAAPVPGRLHLGLDPQRDQPHRGAGRRSPSWWPSSSRWPWSGRCAGPAGAGACGPSGPIPTPRSGSGSGPASRSSAPTWPRPCSPASAACC